MPDMSRSKSLTPSELTPCVKQVYFAEGLLIDLATRDGAVGSDRLGLTELQFEILWFLINRPGTAFCKHKIADELKGNTQDVIPAAVAAHIAEIRARLAVFGLANLVSKNSRREYFIKF